MKKLEDVSITRYESGDFYIEIAESDNMREAWLRHKDCGISELMFSMPIKQVDGITSYDWFLDIVESNLTAYKDSYNEEYIDAF